MVAPSHSSSAFVDPLLGQLSGFVLLTLPVVAYFATFESSALRATPGKRLLGLRVLTTSGRDDARCDSTYSLRPPGGLDRDGAHRGRPIRMTIGRRDFLAGVLGLAAGGPRVLATLLGEPHSDTTPKGASSMYGLIGKFTAVPGERDALAEILLESVTDMPGCLSYVVAADPEDENALWITEVWESQASHEASLSLPAVQEAIEEGRPLIADMGDRTVTRPLGGHGLSTEGTS